MSVKDEGYCADDEKEKHHQMIVPAKRRNNYKNNTNISQNSSEMDVLILDEPAYHLSL